MSGLFDTLSSVSSAYAATLAIGVVCAYLGLFTVLRRIVFTGVALAQLAAAGVAGAFFVADASWLPAWLTGAATRHGATVGSLGLALLGALGLHARPAQKRVTPDALVGLAYAASSAIAVLLVWRSPHGLAELHNILAGEVLLTREGELVSLWVGLLAVALVQLRWRREFLLVSYDPEFARALRLPEARLQLLLLGSLAVAVAVSLKAGGLLLVFSFLVLPPMTGLLLGRGLPEATWLALGVAAGASLVGFLAAIGLDLPVAPTVATTQALLFGAAWLARLRPQAATAARVLVLVLAVAALATLPLVLLHGPAPRPVEPAPEPPSAVVAPEDDHEHTGGEDLHAVLRALASGDTPEAREAAAERVGREGDASTLDALVAALEDEDAHVRDVAGGAIEALVTRRPDARARLDALVADAAHPERRMLAAAALWRLGDVRAVELHVQALGDDGVPLMLKDRALHRLEELSGGKTFGYDPFADPAANGTALATWQQWWAVSRDKVKWDPTAKTFRVE